MNRIFCFVLFLFILCAFAVNGQNVQYVISGLVKDADTGEPLIGIPIGIREIPSKGVHTDEQGFYSIKIPSGEYTLVLSYMGYKEKTIKIKLNKNTTRDIKVEPSSFNLDEVVISDQKPDENVTKVQTGVEKITMEEVSKLPVLMGERDIIKTLQLLPGVQSTGDGSSGMFVRGGSVDQNLILLDNVALYNASHLMGFFSTFNSEVVRDAVLYKGAMPSQYGDRLAAILDVQHRNGDINKYGVAGGIGLISSNINVEGPIQKGKSSFILGGRRTYADAIARLSGVKEATDAYLYFYDLNFKANMVLSYKDNLSISGYWGKDKMVLKNTAETDWGNLIGSAKWTHTFNNALLSSTTVSYTQYEYHAGMDFGMDMKAQAKISDVNLKQHFSYKPTINSEWTFGLQATYHTLDPGNFKRDTAVVDLLKRRSAEGAVYVSNQLKLSDNFEIIYGVRASLFSALGKGEYYTMDESHNVIDTTLYKSGKVVKSYLNLEPRISAVYKLNNVSSLKAAYARTTQNMHMLSYSASGTPYDRWMMSSNNIKPQIGDQISLGYFRNFDKDTYEFSVEGYYKDLKNQIDFKDNAEFYEYNVIDTELLTGKGRAYGIEFLLKKRKGRLTGWIGYTLSKSEKKIDGINNNKWYNTYQDRRHDISIVGMYDLNAKWSLSAAWVYYTGNAVSYPSGKYQIDGRDVMYYAERNGYRAPAYHRLDLGAVCKLKKTKKYSSELAFSLYNAYGRENAYMIDFRTNDDDPNKTTAYQTSLFKFVPSVSWNFRF